MLFWDCLRSTILVCFASYSKCEILVFDPVTKSLVTKSVTKSLYSAHYFGSMAAKTRSTKHVWLSIFNGRKLGAKLFSGRDDMRIFIQHREHKCTLRDGYYATYDKLRKIWNQSHLRVRLKRPIIDKNTTKNNSL